MAVVTTTVVTVKPGRFEEYVEKMARPSKAITERNGGRNVRLLAGVVAGEATGALVITNEADDFAAAGATIDKSLADPDTQTRMSLGDDNPIASYQVSQWIEIPL
jgi:hypothetical protein